MEFGGETPLASRVDAICSVDRSETSWIPLCNAERFTLRASGSLEDWQHLLCSWSGSLIRCAVFALRSTVSIP